MKKNIGRGVGRIFGQIRGRYLGRTTHIAAVAAALGSASCGDPGLLNETAGHENSEPTASEQQASTCQTICLPHYGCFPYCPPPQPPQPPPPPRGSLAPEFFITHVVYAPPGRSSEVKYSSSTKVGSSSKITDGFQSGVKIEAEASVGGPVGGSATLGATFEATQSRTDTEAQDLAVKYSQGYKKPGQSDRIDHDYDEIWFLVRPKLDFTYLEGATPADPDTIRWKFGQQDGENHGIPYFVYAGELNNSMTMRKPVKDALDYWGIGPEDYPTLLAADPLFTGSSPNTDTERFENVGTFPFSPPRNPGDNLSIQDFTMERTDANTFTREAKNDYSVALSASVSGSTGPFTAKLTVEGQWSWSSSQSYSNSIENASTDSLSIGQPAHGYTGPTLVRAYLDKIYNTFAFTLDYPQGEKNLALNRPSWQSSTYEDESYDDGPENANDGDTNGDFWGGSVTHTNAGYLYTAPDWPGQFWLVDLGKEHVVNAVNIFNRTDCCSERLSNYNILVYDSMIQNWKVISDHSTDNTTGVGFLHHPIDMVRTQWVMIAKTDDNYLSLAEVQVIGYE